MGKRTKVLIAAGVGCAGIVALTVFGLLAVYRAFVAAIGGGATFGPRTPGVVTGAGFLTKDVFFSDSALGTVTDIAFGALDPQPGVVMGIAGIGGAVFLDESHNVKSSVTFPPRLSRVNMIEVDGDRSCEFMNRGSWRSDASLLDHAGKPLWSYGGPPGVDDTCAGDLDQDGQTEFAVGFNGHGGLHLLDQKGRKKWQQPDWDVWHAEMVDTNGDGRLEIVHTNGHGQIVVRNPQGNIVTAANPAARCAWFSLCRWPDKTSPQYVLNSTDNAIWLFDFQGRTVARLDAPGAGDLGDARGTLVKLTPGAPEYLAVLVELPFFRGSVLYVYDHKGSLVYQEMLPEACKSIAARPSGAAGVETILVGGTGRVLQYKATGSG